MTSEESAELHARLTELKSEKEIVAFMAEVAKKHGEDDPLVLNLGEHAAMIVASLDAARDKHLYLVTFILRLDGNERVAYHYGVWAPDNDCAEELAEARFVEDLAEQDLTLDDVSYEVEVGLLDVINEEFA